MSKILDIILISTISFGTGGIFGPQIVNGTSKKIDETVPQIKDKLKQAKKHKDMEKNEDLKIPQENIIIVQDFGNCGYGTYDIINNLNIPTNIISLENKGYISKFPNDYFNSFKIKDSENAGISKDHPDMLIIPEYFTIKIVEGTDYGIKNFILPKKQIELIQNIVNTKKDVKKIINENNELKELMKNPLLHLEQINKILND